MTTLPTKVDCRCFLLHGSHATEGVLSGGNWILPLDNLLLPTIKEDVARCVTGNLEDAVLTLSLPKALTVGGLAVVGHTLPGGGKVRVTWRRGGPAGNVVGPQPAWQRVYPRTSKTKDLSYDDPEWWRGGPSAALRAVYPGTFLVAPPTRLRADTVTLEFDARRQAFDLGHLLLSPLWRPDWPMSWGRELSVTSLTLTDTTPGGKVIAGLRQPQRAMLVTFDDLSKPEAMQLVDMSMVGDVIGPLLFVPDPGDPLNFWREVFLARLKELVSVTEKEDGYYRIVLKIVEILA